ncbi:DUF6193 family natural product biosynthesis protein [Streptomyces sp. NPDC052676]|uniref:DUF6193 family natural product biosynthesis protein n=1 Tax=Streptomyces sp. NPDC052676 TaxID=3154953 RepID=UPI00344170A6
MVEAGGQKVRDDGRVRPELLEAAYAGPRLRQLFPWRSDTVRPAATPQEAIAMVIERLPPNTGPAFVGTPAELAAHEATASSTAAGPRSVGHSPN